MAGSLIKAVVSLPRISGLSEDTVVNTFYFDSTDDPPAVDATVDAIKTRLVSFYNDVHTPGTADLASFMSEALSRVANAARMDFYTKPYPLDATPWGSPDEVRSWTLDAAAAGTPMPAEVATCLSFNADLTDVPETSANPTPPPLTIRPASRRRGRVYIGPLQVTAIGEDTTTHEAYVVTGLRNALRGAGTALRAANTAAATWVVYSATSAERHDVVGGFVDIAFDSQRRRGEAPQLRETWT